MVLRSNSPGAKFAANIRRLAEHVSRGIVISRHLPREFLGLPVYVSPEAGLRFWRRGLAQVDPMLFRMARELVTPGGVVWDIGANVGLFTFSAAALAGPSGFVLAIEPDIWLAHLLQRSAWRVRNKSRMAAPVATLAAALSEADRIVELSIAARARASNHLVEIAGSSQTNGERSRQHTVAISLDFLLQHFPPPSVLKIDVEGAETMVLSGASKLLRTARPNIWCEVAAENQESVAQLLHNAGYQIYAAALDPDKRVPLRRASWDTLAKPSACEPDHLL